MQPTPSGRGNSSGVGGGGSGSGSGSGDGVTSGEPNQVGLARFRSAPAAWLEALLEDEQEEDETLKRNQTLTHLLASSIPASRNAVNPLIGSSSVERVNNFFEPVGFQRHHSSPADFLGNSELGSDGYFSNFGIPSSFDYMAQNIDTSASSKRTRETELHQSPAKFAPLLKGEQSSQAPGGVSGLMEMEMEMEKLMEDSVPCRVRAKRGCATHPRSIAERVRRTRISDRIRKLQELVPNMDKQTNTAGMLDEAVEYVKFLQKHIKELTEHQRRCTCMMKE